MNRAVADQGMTIPDREREFDTLQDLVDDALDHARRLGADGAQASTSLQGGISVTVRLGEVETIEHNRDRGFSITVYKGRRKGSASSGDLEAATLRDCVERAVEIAKFTEDDPCNGLPDADRLASNLPDLDLWHPQPLDVNAAIERALAIEAAGRADAGIRNSEGATVYASQGLTVLGDSQGFRGRHSGTRHGQSCVLIAGEGEGMQRDYWYDSQRRASDLEAPEVTGLEAARRTLRRLGARKIETRRAPVLFAPDIARGLLGHLVGAVSGSALYRNASFLRDMAGESLFPAGFQVSERPHLVRGPGSAAFDAEGVETRERELIDDGVLTGYVLSSYAARRLGLQSTGNAGGVHNLLVSGQLTPIDELLTRMGDGLLVTEVMGQGVRLVTGDYSRGAAGFWVENGQLAYPVEEVTIAGNLKDMFAGVVAAGDDLDRRANIQCGSLLIGEMTIAGA